MQRGAWRFASMVEGYFRNPNVAQVREEHGWSATADRVISRALRETWWGDVPNHSQLPRSGIDSRCHSARAYGVLRAVRLNTHVTQVTPRLDNGRGDGSNRPGWNEIPWPRVAEALGFVAHELQILRLSQCMDLAEYLLRYSKERASNEAAAIFFQEIRGRLGGMITTYSMVPYARGGAGPCADHFSRSDETGTTSCER